MLHISKKGHKARGFTLIELLVVIAIIGILSSVVLASLNSARQKGRDAKRISDVKQLQLALELYYDAHSGYPAAVSGALAAADLVTPGYIASIPTDPQTGAAYSYEGLASNGTTACTTGPCSKYVIGTTLENGSNSVLTGDIDTVYSGGPDCTDPMYCVTP